MKVKIKDLQLADVIRLFDGPYGDGTVKNVTDERVFIIRPWILTQDFSYSGGVLSTIGIEDIVYYKVSEGYREVEVLERKTLK